MSRYTAVLEKNARRPEPFPAADLAPARAANSPSNAFATLVARLFGGPEPLRTVAFTSALPGEGVTSTARQAAEEAARTTGLRTAVVSAGDLLTAPAVQVLGAPPAAKPTGRSGRLSALLEDFDVVLVDAGSLQTDGSIVGIASKVAAVILVVEAGRTGKADVAHAVDTITAAGGKVAGLVLNKRRRAVPRWLENLIG